MIITQTPFRMSFFGGGTDMPEFFNEYGGAVISTSFDKYCYVTVRHLPPFFAYHTEIAYSRIEKVQEAEEIMHPLVRHAMAYRRIRDIRLTYEADLPARSGLGTSSSFAVGMLHAFHTLKGKTQMPPRQLAQEAIYLERTLCQEAGGWQDQIAAAYGGMNRIDFRNNDYTVTPLAIPPERKKLLNDRLLLFFTGFTRLSSDIQKETKPIEEKTKELREMLQLVDVAQGILEGNGSLDEFGRLLDTTWRLKRSTGGNVSTSEIDICYEKAMRAGALGGKLLGAGGGGFLVFYVPDPQVGAAVQNALQDLMLIPFRFSNEGSRVIFNSPETYSFRGEDK